MDFLELAKSRYSERRFDPRPIEQEKIDKIIEAGRVVPTACNYQPQRVYILKSEQALAKAKTVTPFTYNAPLMLLVCYDMNTVWKQPNDRYYHHYNSGEQDASIAAATMMYEAEELGVHTIWIRGFDSKSVVDAFNLPDNIIPVMMMGLGYPTEQSKPHAWHFKNLPTNQMATEL